MLASVNDLHDCLIAGTLYQFRSPDIFDQAKIRRSLRQQKVRHPSAAEFRVAALAGVKAMAEIAGEPDEGARQAALVGDWFELQVPTDEDDIDEPDLVARGEIVAEKETERMASLRAITPEVMAIRANLERHWPDYAALLGDSDYWDDVSKIEVVRLLLVSISGGAVKMPGEDFIAPQIYQSIPVKHRMALATFAFHLLGPDGGTRKN